MFVIISETVQTVPIKFAVKIVQLEVYMAIALLVWWRWPLKFLIASQTWLLFKLAIQYLSYYIQTWHDSRLMHGFELDRDFENVCMTCPACLFCCHMGVCILYFLLNFCLFVCFIVPVWIFPWKIWVTCLEESQSEFFQSQHCTFAFICSAKSHTNLCSSNKSVSSWWEKLLPVCTAITIIIIIKHSLQLGHAASVYSSIQLVCSLLVLTVFFVIGLFFLKQIVYLKE